MTNVKRHIAILTRYHVSSNKIGGTRGIRTLTRQVKSLLCRRNTCDPLNSFVMLKNSVTIRAHHITLCHLFLYCFPRIVPTLAESEFLIFWVAMMKLQSCVMSVEA